eukprot:1192262-Prorocentrum_minimum.AAC.3
MANRNSIGCVPRLVCVPLSLFPPPLPPRPSLPVTDCLLRSGCIGTHTLPVFQTHSSLICRVPLSAFRVRTSASISSPSAAVPVSAVAPCCTPLWILPLLVLGLGLVLAASPVLWFLTCFRV